MRTWFAAVAFVPAAAWGSALGAQLRQDTTAARDSAALLETVTVSAIRGGARDAAPVSATTLDAADIERRSFGQDVPLLLQGTPSLTSYSETGSYWGYSYIRLRGIDQSRINLTIDGIPLNDPEDQVLYFADFPDLANSLGSVQIQRGVGSSAPGTASYGGSINLQTLPLLTTKRSAQLQLQGGSFGSARASAEYASGLTARNVAVYARLSAIQSAGYRAHSGMEGRSGLMSAAYFGERDVLKFTAIAGLFADTMAYVGATESELRTDRRFNPLRPDEVDRFGEQVAALAYTRQLGGSSLATTLYRISASGNYDVCIDQCDQPVADLWNFGLDFTWYGATTAWTLERQRLRLDVGANANTYARDHSAFDRPAGSLLYVNTGRKDDASLFAKAAYDAGPVTLSADLQARRALFRYLPDANAGIGRSSIGWTFVNPKVGATWRLSPALHAYVSYGVNSREPARSDMLAGFDNLDTSNESFVGPLDRVRPERAGDLEAGTRFDAERWSLRANAFRMAFRNEILPVGELSYIGTPLRTNVRSSWRRGVEAAFAAAPLDALEIGLTATAMSARIAEFTDAATGTSYQGVRPVLTPSFISAQRVSLHLSPALMLTVGGQYTGRSQLTNTDDASLVLPASYVANLIADWSVGEGSSGFSLRVNNVGNSRRYASGHVSQGAARYYVLPPLNVLLVARLGM